MHPHWKCVARVAALPALISLGACQKRTADESESEPAIATPAPATPSATPPPVAVATLEPNYFAPPGVYFLIAAASIETADGIVGLKPGTRLQKTGPGKYAGNGHQLELHEHRPVARSSVLG